MTTVLLDPVQVEATASAISDHAREIEAAVAGLESLGATSVPPELAGWLAQELGDVATIARLSAVLYLVAALDALQRAGGLQADQSLAQAAPDLDGGGFVLGQVDASATSGPTYGIGSPGFVLGQVDASATSGPTYGIGSPGFVLHQPGEPSAEYLALVRQGILTLPDPLAPLGGYTPALGGGSSLGDISGHSSLQRLLLSTPGRTHIGNGIYEGSGMRGAFHAVLPDPGHEE